MRLFCYNINGIRAALKKDFSQWLQISDPDILCLQEVKALETQIDLTIFRDLGYHVYWHPAERKGYSGVAVLSKIEAKEINYGIGNTNYDHEGRFIHLVLDNFNLINVYLPSGSMGDHRQIVKYEWLDLVYDYLQTLKNTGKQVIACGDFNICHQSIDIHNPEGNKNTSGFLPEERSWMSKLFSNGYIDTFRSLNPDKQAYTWWSYRARAKEKDLGWRIDYFAISENLKSKIQRATILKEIHFSDHCPIVLEVDTTS